MSEIVIQIDSLVLNGIVGFNSDRFGSALSSELTQLVSGATPLQGLWTVESLEINLSSAYDVEGVGIQVARAIYAQMLGGAV